MKPTEIFMFSNKKVHWKCQRCGFEWVQTVGHRAKGMGCPACAGKVAVAGYNDMASKFPQLIHEWNYERNGALTPELVLPKSGKKVWWRCDKGHEWQATVANRTGGSKCPICSKKSR